MDATAAASLAIVFYAGHNGAASLSSIGGGHLADRFTPRHVLMAAASVYVAGYTTFAIGATAWPILLAAFVLCGVGIGCAETAESTIIARSVPDIVRGNGFGLQGLIQAFGDLGATLVVGFLWSLTSPAVTFGYAAAWMVTALLVAGRRGR